MNPLQPSMLSKTPCPRNVQQTGYDLSVKQLEEVEEKSQVVLWAGKISTVALQ